MGNMAVFGNLSCGQRSFSIFFSTHIHLQIILLIPNVPLVPILNIYGFSAKSKFLNLFRIYLKKSEGLLQKFFDLIHQLKYIKWLRHIGEPSSILSDDISRSNSPLNIIIGVVL